MAQTITNLLENPSFETGTAATFAVNLGQTFGTSSVESVSGTSSLLLSADGTQGFCSAHLATPSGLGGSAVPLAGAVSIFAPNGRGMSLRFRCFYTDATSAYTAASSISGTGGFTRYTVAGTTDAAKTLDYVRLAISVATSSAATEVYIDAGLVHEGATPVAYFDGDSPNAEWTGTPHASTSIITLPARRIFPVLKVGSSHIGPLRAGKA